MKQPLEHVWRADSIFDGWKGRKGVTKIKFRNIVCRMAAWQETYTGEKPSDRWFDRVVEDMDLSLTADEVVCWADAACRRSRLTIGRG